MDKKIKVRHVNIITLFLVSTFNLISGISNNWNYERFVFYVAPFVIVLFVCIFLKSYKLDAILFFLMTQLCILIGEWGNLSAVLFLCFSIYCFEYKKLIYLILSLTLITIVLKFMFLKQNSTVAEGIMYCVGIGYALTIYYLLMHPKTVFYLNENNIDKKVIQLLLQGNKNKEIAYKIGITQNAVTKRLENMRKRNNCGNNEQLIFNLIKEREIVLK